MGNAVAPMAHTTMREKDFSQHVGTYRLGDYVVPTDLPRSFLCRVTHEQAVDGTSLQLLELVPLEGPWPRTTRLVRGSDWVRPAMGAVERARIRRHRLRAARPRRRGRTIGAQPRQTRPSPTGIANSFGTPTSTPVR